MKFVWEANDIIAGRLIVDAGGEPHVICWLSEGRGQRIGHVSLLDGMVIVLDVPLGADGFYPGRSVQDAILAEQLTANGYIPAEMWSGPAFVDAVIGRRVDGKHGDRFPKLRNAKAWE